MRSSFWSTTWVNIALVFIPGFIWSQHSNLFEASILDKSTGEPLESVTIFIPSSGTGTVTDSTGFFSLKLTNDWPIEINLSYIGYDSKTLLLNKENYQKIETIYLQSSNLELEEVVIGANSVREKFRSTNTSVETIDAKQARVLPALFGEVDIIKTIQLKPGIASGSEGSSGLFVRGGNGDQNLILLDGVNIYNPSHLFGFFSTFNNDALSTVDVYKGGFPAQYGGRLSSVIDIKTKDLQKDSISGSGGLGLISSRLTIDGPLFENTSFLVSGRRTYVDIFTELANKINENNENFSPIPRYRFYDLNGKITSRIGKKDRITFSGYTGADVFSFNNDLFNMDFNWGNNAGSLHWNHSFSNTLFSDVAVTYTDYEYTIANALDGFDFNLSSQIKDLGMKWDLFYEWNNQLWRGGIQAIHHRFKLGRFKFGSTDDDINFSAGSEPEGTEIAAFLGNKFSLLPILSMDIGIRYSGFIHSEKFYQNIEPRIAANVEVTDRFNIKASYAQMNQYVHLVSNNGLSLPTDLWYPSTDNVKPQKSEQTVLGFNLLLDKSLLLTNEYYYKKLYNQIELKDHAQIFVNDQIEEEFTFGDGYAYGTEIGLEKTAGKWTGWIGYTLAWVRRGNFKDIQEGDYFPPKYDRRHDLSIVSTWKINDKWNISTTFVYGSGDKSWLPAGRFFLQGVDGSGSFPAVPIYTDRNTTSVPNYHRMDLSIERSFKAKWGKHSLNLSIYNLYNRRNPYFLYLDTELKSLSSTSDDNLNVPVSVSAKQVSLFPIIPSLSWNFNF
ncbi:TonB-dependent receptor [Membranihabitans maritimus]|uniref:TonB-dependent receptor n=1 Tax=Membranihabitans maritimus TaxID=2904244 RepID=UPI001F3F1FF1|nr:TonB-dependent receptor [Membranihabitans maritimus]